MGVYRILMDVTRAVLMQVAVVCVPLCGARQCKHQSVYNKLNLICTDEYPQFEFISTQLYELMRVYPNHK